MVNAKRQLKGYKTVRKKKTDGRNKIGAIRNESKFAGFYRVSHWCKFNWVHSIITKCQIYLVLCTESIISKCKNIEESKSSKVPPLKR